jgi:flagellar biosynthesis anti-sigma factor FlgM
MKISDSTLQTSVLPTAGNSQRASNNSGNNVAIKSQDEDVQISDLAKAIASSEPKGDSEKIRELRNAVTDGTYRPNATNIAHGLVGDFPGQHSGVFDLRV